MPWRTLMMFFRILDSCFQFVSTNRQAFRRQSTTNCYQGQQEHETHTFAIKLSFIMGSFVLVQFILFEPILRQQYNFRYRVLGSFVPLECL